MMRSKLNFQAIVVRSNWKAIQKWMVWGVESLLLAVVPIQASVSFDYVELDASYFAYERDVGDIDGDGDNDIVGVQEGDTTLQVFRAPNWARSTLITITGTYRYPRADDFKLADINGDGKLDVVTRLGIGPADDGAGIAVWYENLGGGNFTQRLIGNSLKYVKDIVVADFDRDGRLDVVMRMDSQTQVWLQEPNGSWTEVVLSHPAHEGMEAGDLNGDGIPDIILNGFWFETPNTPAAARAATNYTYRVIDGAWFNQGGDWTADSCKVVVGDFDGDGTNDVAFSHSERAGYDVAWYRSANANGAGPWVKHAVTRVDYCHNLQAADFNLDGRVDLLVGGMIQSPQRGLTLMLNQGGGTSWSPLVIQSNGSYSAELGDIDKDGDLDIVGIRNWDSGPTWVYRNNAAGLPSLDFWFYKEVSAAHERTFGLCFPDVNSDGNKDIASGSFVYVSPGAPLTGPWTQVSLPDAVHAFATLDVDGDNLADLVAQKDNPGAGRIDLYWVEASNTAGTSWSPPILIGDVPRGSEPEGFQGYAVAQINTGGWPEIIVNSPQGLYYFSVPASNPGNGNWPRTFVAANNSEEGIGVADIDNDGDLDVSFTHANPHEVKWARNPGDGSGDWAVFTIGTFAEADWPDRCAAADLNGDGRVDIIVTEENSGNAPDALACWWEQPASGATNANWVRHTITTQYTMNSLDVGDVDEDGDVDLVLAEHRGSKRIAIWANDGQGNFTEHRVDEGKESHLGGRLVDLDNDGDLDLVSIAYDDFNQLHLWRNDGRRTRPLALESVTPLGLTAVQVVFSKPVEAASAQLPQNYQISKGVTVTWAVLGSDARTVTLVTSPLYGGTYTLTVGKVADRSNPPEQIAPSSQTNFNFAPAATPITFDSSASAQDLDGDDIASVRLTHGDLTNGYVIVGIYMWDPNSDVTISAASYDGVPLSFLGTSRSASSYAEVYLFGAPVVDKAAGSYVVSVKGSANVEQIVLGASAFSGVHQSASTRAFAAANGTFRPPTGLSSQPLVRVASAAGDVVVDVLGYDDGNSVLGPGQIQNWKIPGNGSLSDGVSSRKSAVSSTTTMTHVLDFQGVEWAAGAVALRRAASPVVDVTAPTVSITSPANGLRLTNPIVAIRGTAADAGGVAAVEYRLENANGIGEYQLASGTTVWSASVSGLTAGANTIRVRVRDRNGNVSPSVARTCTYVVLSPFTLLTEGNGTVSPNRNGQALEIGKTYSMTALPAARHLFAGWSGEALSSNALLTFVMRSNSVLHASFVTNPFVGLKGSYYGLFHEANQSRNHDRSGNFSLVLTEAGYFSARFGLGGRALAAAGRFDWLGRARLNLRPSVTNVVAVELSVDVTNLTSGITGLVGDGNWLAELTGFRAATYLGTNASPFAGRFTLAIPGSDDEISGPAGHGYGIGLVARSGLMTYSGRLPDGTPISQSVAVSAEGHIPLYSALFSGRGSVLGWLEFDDEPESDLNGGLHWTRPAVVTSRFYPLGFTNETEAVGSRYLPPTINQRAVDISEGAVEFSFGNLPQSFTNEIRLEVNNRVTNSSSNRLALTIVPSTGFFTGSVVDPLTGRTASFNGALLQKATTGFGYFLGTNRTGRVTLVPRP